MAITLSDKISYNGTKNTSLESNQNIVRYKNTDSGAYFYDSKVSTGPKENTATIDSFLRDNNFITCNSSYSSTADILCLKCVNCYNCAGETSCPNCQICNGCQTCTDCQKCNGCEKCAGCQTCTTCQKCTNCQICNDCHTCTACASCNSCQPCFGCNENCYSYNG